MWFLIKGAFWFSLVLVLLPIFDRGTAARLEGGPQVELSEAFSAATEAYQYVSAICLAKPDVCEKGGETFVALGHRAREGARLAYEFLDEKFSGDTPMSADDLAAQMPALPALPETATEASHDGNSGADDVVTGTVLTVVPLPMKKPVL